MQNRFDFLESRFPKLAEYGRKAEEALGHDNNICLLNLGRIGEAVAGALCQRNNIHYDGDIDSIVHELFTHGIIDENIRRKIDTLTELKDDAASNGYSSESTASRLITTAQELCEWFVSDDGFSRFGFLDDLFPASAPFPTFANLAMYGREAEENLYSNTRYCLICLGDIGEAVVDFIMQQRNIHLLDEDYIEKIKFLFERGIISITNNDILHDLRMARNKAAHNRYDSEEEGRRLIDEALALCEWIFFTNASPGDFIRGSISRINETGLDVLAGKIQCRVSREEIPSEPGLYRLGERRIFRVIDKSDDRINLSLSQIYTDPWSNAERRYGKYSVGQILTVTVTRIIKGIGAAAEIMSGNETVEAGIPEAEYGGRNLKVGNVLRARVKWCSSRYYPYIILSVRDLEQRELPETPEVQIGRTRKSAMSDSEFLIFCRTASYEDMLAALDDGANPNARSSNGQTALMAASESCRKPKVISALIDAGAELEDRDQNGNTALILAAAKNSPEVVKMLVTKGADIEAVNHDMHKAVDFALENKKLKDTEIISLLTSNEPELESESEPETESVMSDEDFLALCRRGTDEEILRAIDSGANVNAVSAHGMTVLMELAKHSGAEVIASAVSHGADVNAVNANGNTALIVAAMHGKEENIEELLTHNPDANVVNREGMTALRYAEAHAGNISAAVMKKLKRADERGFAAICRTGSAERIIEAVSHGANANAKTVNMKSTALMYTAKRSSRKAVEALLENGADVNAHNINGETALMWAAGCNSEEIVELLLDSGADAEAVDKEGRTALAYAEGNARISNKDLLARLGAETESEPEQPEMTSETESEPEQQELLPETETEPEQPEMTSETESEPEQQEQIHEPLTQEQEHEAKTVLRMTLQRDFLRICRSGTLEDITQALDAGVSVNVKNKDSASALMFAAQSSSAEAVDLLIQAGADINAQDKFGNTALIYAASYNTDDVVSTLLNAGANPETRNYSGYSALDYASRNYRLSDSDALAALEHN